MWACAADQIQHARHEGARRQTDEDHAEHEFHFAALVSFHVCERDCDFGSTGPGHAPARWYSRCVMPYRKWARITPIRSPVLPYCAACILQANRYNASFL